MTRFTATIAGGALAIGILTGAAGAIVVSNATDDGLDRHHEQMGSMMSSMSASGMGSMMGGSGSMGPGGSQHQPHRPDTGR